MRNKVSNFEYLKAKLVEVSSDDFSLPWDTYQCLEWDRYIDPHIGRGYIYSPVTKRKELVARIAFQMTKGTLPDGLGCCHHCDRPACFRPSHLFSGSQKSNMEDCVKKGRMPRGEARPIAKLTAIDILEILNLDSAGVMRKDIASRFGVSESTIWQIFAGKSWRHVNHGVSK